jgi:hypothetical protein
MNFSDFFISVEDYDFFQSLPNSEKILFAYDLICNDSYGTGSSELEKIDAAVTSTNLSNSFDFIDQLNLMVRKSIDLTADVNVFFINNFVIINSNYRSEIQSTVKQLFTNGLVLIKMRPGKSTLDIFKHQKHLSIYHIAGQHHKIFQN